VRYVNSYLQSKQSKYGIRKIRYDLLQKNIDSEILEQVIADNTADEYAIAYAIWQRKFGATPSDTKERQRQMRFLQSRGFGIDVIVKIINNK
jgi:regulatory protein